MKGKLLALCVSILMVVTLFTPVFTASADVATVVAIEDTLANIAEPTFKVPVSVTRNAGFTTGNVQIVYDYETFEYVSTQPVAGFDITESDEDAGVLDLLIDYTGSGDYTQDGIICYIEFSFTEYATSGEYEIAIDGINDGFGNTAEELLNVEYAEGTLEIHEGVHYIQTKAPTYTETGIETGYCDECDRELSVTRTIPKLANAVYTVGNANINSDGTTETASVDLSISGNNGFYTTIFTVSASGLTFTGADAVNGLEAVAGERLVLTSTSNANYTANGKVATLNFTIDDPTVSDVYTVTLAVADAANWDEQSLEPTVNGTGTVTVTVEVQTVEYPTFATENGITRYYTAEGVYATGWQTIDGNQYYFSSKNGKMITGVTAISSVYYDFGNDGICQGRYTGATGTGTSLQVYEDGALVKSSWYKSDNGDYYYLNKSGVPATGLIYLSNENRYYQIGNDGILINRNGLYADKDGNTRYYRDNVAQSGWQTIDGSTYYFSIATTDKYGAMVKGKTTTINNVSYTFDANGRLIGNSVGFTVNSDNKTVYYATENDLAKGWFEIDGNWYYFSTKSNAMFKGVKTINGKSFTFSEQGVLDGSLEFVDVDGGKQIQVNGKVLTGWQTVNGYRYYTSSKTNLLVTGNKTISGVAYTFLSDGKLDVPNYGFNTAGTVYYSNSEFASGWKSIDGKMYYFKSTTGVALTGLRILQSKYAYEFDEDGSVIGLKNGFYTDSIGTHYYSNGLLKAKSKEAGGDNGWLTIYGEKRYFNTSGVMVTGVKSLSGIYYDLGNDGISKGVVDGFANTGTATIYCVEGVAQKNWQLIDGDYYYFNSAYEMLTGARTIGGKSYTFGADGKLDGTVTVTISGGKKYMKIAGNALSGWVFINNNAYYNRSSDGSLVYGSTTTIQGHAGLIFDDNGVCTNYNEIMG